MLITRTAPRKLLSPGLSAFVKCRSISSRATYAFVSRWQASRPRSFEQSFATLSSTTSTNHDDVNSLSDACEKTKVCVVGSGNWGSAIAKIIGNNALSLPFCEDQVNMWVHEELVHQPNGTPAKLSKVINQCHENVKYLPNISLPENVVAVPDLAQACQGANLLIFVVPHQFLPPILPEIKQNISTNARGISLIKGLEFDAKTHTPVQISHVIEQTMGDGFRCGALMGANLAKEVARGDFCESTLACDFGRDDLNEKTRLVFAADSFSVQHCKDVAAAEVCGALKNVVALGAGFVDGLGLGGNTKAALLRVGILEIMDFAQRFFKGVKYGTFFESCGVADLIATCYGGRNRKCAEAFTLQASPGQTPGSCVQLWATIEQKLLNGQKLQGTLATEELYQVLLHHNLLDQFPLFSMIHAIAFEGRPVGEITTSIHPVEHDGGRIGLPSFATLMKTD